MASKGHSGHRKRIRTRIMKYGIESLEDHELLEYLLYYVIPRKNTNPLGHSLIEKFGSLNGVFDASVDDLREAGLSERGAYWLHSMRYVCGAFEKYYRADIEGIGFKPDELSEFLKDMLKDTEPGGMAFLSLNSRGQLKYKSVYMLNKDPIERIRDVTQRAVQNDAYFVVIAQHFPDKRLIPKEEDLFQSINYNLALKSLDIILLDQYHYCNNHCFSYREVGLLFKTRDEYYRSGVYRMLDFSEED